MTGLWNAWSLVTSLRWEDHAHLAAWHLWLVLLVLGGFAGFGAHYVLGYIFRFYWRQGRFQWWIALLALPVLMVSTFALIWTYALDTGAGRLSDRLLHDAGQGEPPLAIQVGAYLLQPAFDHAPVEPGAAGPTGAALAQALAALPADSLRKALGAESEDNEEAEESARAPAAQAPPAPADAPAAEPPQAEGGAPPAEETIRPAPRPHLAAAETPAGPAPVILAIVREWITDPDQSWPILEAGEGERAAGREPGAPLSPADFIVSLIREIPAESALPASDWAYVAGQRFDERLLGPMLLEYLHTSAATLAILIVLLNVGYFWMISRMNRPPKAAKTAAPKATAQAEPPKAEV